MKIREIFAGNIATMGMAIQHQSQLIVASILLFADWYWNLNEHKEFTFILKM